MPPNLQSFKFRASSLPPAPLSKPRANRRMRDLPFFVNSETLHAPPPKDADFQSPVFRLWRPPVKRGFPKKFHWKHASNLEHFLHEIITVWSLQKVYQLLFKKPISTQWLYLLSFKYYKIYSIYSDNF